MSRVIKKSRWLVWTLAGAAASYFLASGSASLAAIPLAAAGVEARLERDSPAPSARPRPTPPLRSGEFICDRNVFDSGHRPCGTSEPPPPGDDPTTHQCPSEAQLVATFVATHNESSFAVIRHRGRAHTLAIGGELDGIGSLSGVDWRHVHMQASDGLRCLLDMDRPDSPPPASPAIGRPPPRANPGTGAVTLRELEGAIEARSASQFVLDRGVLERLISDPSILMRHIGGRPHFVNGELRGFRVRGSRGSALLQRLGLRSGDVIQSVNGIELTSLDRPMEAFLTLRHADRLAISVLRRGRSQSLEYNIQAR